MKCAWICFALFIANSAANPPYGGGGVYHNSHGGGGGVNHMLPNEGGGVSHNLPNGVHMVPNGGGGGVNHMLPNGGGGEGNFNGDADGDPGIGEHPNYDYNTDYDLTDMPMQVSVRMPGVGPAHPSDVLRPEKNPSIKIPSNARLTPSSTAFSGCEKHPENTKSSSAIDSNYQSEVMPVNKNGAYVAVHPLQEMSISSPIFINVMMPSFSYELEVQGSSMMLSRCNVAQDDCKLEDESSMKGNNLINPHEWNYLHLMFSDNTMTMKVGDSLQVQSENTISESDMSDATWVIESGGAGDGVPFLVQFPCSEYRDGRTDPPVTPLPPAAPPVTPDHHSPLPKPSHNKNGTAESEKETGGGGLLAVLVIGILLAVILVALLAALVISTIKKKRSMAVTEDTPLGQTNQSYAQNQQKADTQTDTSADTKTDTSADSKAGTKDDSSAA